MINLRNYPTFSQWYVAQTPATQGALNDFYDATASDPSIAQGAGRADYARAKLLFDHAAVTYGFLR